MPENTPPEILFAYLKKRKSKILFATPDEAKAWVAAMRHAANRTKKGGKRNRILKQIKQAAVVRPEHGRQSRGKVSRVPLREPLPEYVSPQFSDLARESLIQRLAQIESCRPAKAPYEPARNVVANGPDGLLAYANRLVTYLCLRTNILEKEGRYLDFLAGILDRERSSSGSALRDAVAHCRRAQMTAVALKTPPPIMPPDAKRLPWRVLPPGSWKFSDVQSHFRALSKVRRDLEWDLGRLEFAQALRPTETWIGKDEFEGYVIFVLGRSQMALLDHPLKGNACYVLRGDWKALAALPKQELLTRHQKAVTRVVHYGNWRRKIRAELKRPQ